MNTISRYSLLFLLLALGSSSFIMPKDRKPKKGKMCKTEKNCTDLENPCKCWCSVKCGPRDKTEDDEPIYFNKDEDPFGKGCYCQQRDLDLYDKNCAGKQKRKRVERKEVVVEEKVAESECPSCQTYTERVVESEPACTTCTAK
jgi:hypothetical protein